jgi:hypothetical protein
MDEEFEIPVVFKSQQLFFKARRLVLGSSTHKIQVDVYGTDVLYEMDEERNYRAYIDPENIEAIERADKGILQEITNALESLRLGL